MIFDATSFIKAVSYKMGTGSCFDKQSLINELNDLHEANKLNDAYFVFKKVFGSNKNVEVEDILVELVSSGFLNKVFDPAKKPHDLYEVSELCGGQCGKAAFDFMANTYKRAASAVAMILLGKILITIKN